RSAAPSRPGVDKRPRRELKDRATELCPVPLPQAGGEYREHLSAIAAPARVAQPQTDEVALALGLGGVVELGAGVAGGAIVDVRDRAGREVERGAQLRPVEDALHRRERRRGLVVHALALEVVAGIDLAEREARMEPVAGMLEDRRREDGRLVRLVLGV